MVLLICNYMAAVVGCDFYCIRVMVEGMVALCSWKEDPHTSHISSLTVTIRALQLIDE